MTRRRFQGIGNILRFNWHYYALVGGLVSIILLAALWLSPTFAVALRVIAVLAVAATALSLVISFYVYDCSDLYQLTWLDALPVSASHTLANIHAGFDETSFAIAEKYPDCRLHVFDFYDPGRHTEISIRRARKTMAVFPGTRPMDTASVPLKAQSVHYIFTVLAAHEIRDHNERARFLESLGGSLAPNGKIVVVEHLRDLPNFIAYTIGFFHFHSRKEWMRTFAAARLRVDHEHKITPFVTAFTLQVHGTAS